MTRYARAQGSKACNSKQACPATSWQELKEQIVTGKSNTEQVNEDENPTDEEKVSEDDTKGSWFTFQAESKSWGKNLQAVKPCSETKRKREDQAFKGTSAKKTITDSMMKKAEADEESGMKTFGKSGKNKSPKKKNIQKCFTSSGTFKVIDSVPCVKKTVQEKVSTFKSQQNDFEDSKRLVSTLKPHQKDFKGPKKPVSNFKPHPNDLKDSRKLAKALKREKKKVCFCCRRWGHQLADCPEADKDNKMDVIRSPGAFCYNCGSTEHRMSRCNKPGKKTFKYAHCFVCGEEGHLARLCPDNPKGSYPKGGSCHLCGEVTHLRSACPKAKGNSNDLEPTLACTTTGPIEGLPEDLRKPSQPKKSKKIVQFT